MKQEIVQKFGERVKLIRNELRISQKEFASKIGVASSYISELESGKMGAGFEFMYKVSLHYNINPFYLFHGRGPKFFNESFELKSQEAMESLFKDKQMKQLFHWLEQSELCRLEVFLFAKRYILEHEELLKKESLHTYDDLPEFPKMPE